MLPRLVIVGAGGHARVLAEIVHLRRQFQLVGFTDSNPQLKGMKILDVPVLGGDEILPGLRSQGVEEAIVGVGSSGDNYPRSLLFERIVRIGFHPALLIHPTAVLSASVEIGRGVAVMARAVVNPNARLGDNVIVNTGAIVEHDCILGDHVHVASGACLSGGVRVGQMSFVGVGASSIQQVSIGEGCLIGGGAAVVGDIPDHTVALGVPARIVRGHKE
jgi:sugar O-acyltransferase (sialic acid O-acetyltransferase NeuD family)